MPRRLKIRRAGLIVSLGLVLFTPARARAQTFEAINSFTGCVPDGCHVANDGRYPQSTLVVGPDGNFYGTTFGFSGSLGTIYRSTPAGVRTTLVNFDEPSEPGVLGPWGCFPVGQLAVGPDGFYGVTDQCGLHTGGTLFRLTFAGSFSVLHHFDTDEAFTPSGGLAFAPDGDLFGGLGNGGESNRGGVFRWNGSAVTIVHSFDETTGAFPKGDLKLASDGSIYGATTGGGGVAPGTLFRITPDDTVLLFHTFNPLDGFGSFSNGGLLQASDGHLYGTMGDGVGVVYRITLAGVFTPLHTGVFSAGNLLEGFGGVIYGTSRTIGTPTGVFQIAPGGALTTVHSFTGPDGRQPEAGLVRGLDGHLYGTTYYGGAQDLGVFFRVRMAPAVTMSANGSYAPLTLSPGGALTIRMGFDVPGPGLINPAHLLVGFVSPFGVFWLGPSGFGTVPAVLYSGPLPGFGLAPLFTFPTTAGFPPGSYHWFVIVLDGATRVFIDSIETVVPSGV